MNRMRCLYMRLSARLKRTTESAMEIHGKTSRRQPSKLSATAHIHCNQNDWKPDFLFSHNLVNDNICASNLWTIQRPSTQIVTLGGKQCSTRRLDEPNFVQYSSCASIVCRDAARFSWISPYRRIIPIDNKHLLVMFSGIAIAVQASALQRQCKIANRFRVCICIIQLTTLHFPIVSDTSYSGFDIFSHCDGIEWSSEHRLVVCGKWSVDGFEAIRILVQCSLGSDE